MNKYPHYGSDYILNRIDITSNFTVDICNGYKPNTISHINFIVDGIECNKNTVWTTLFSSPEQMDDLITVLQYYRKEWSEQRGSKF